MSKYLINESPLTFQPTLASALGLSEAIVLQQLQYWVSNQKSGVFKEGFKWVYNSYENWQAENFPFWSIDGVKKIFLRLEAMDVLVSRQLSDDKWNKTKYYRINYKKLDELLEPLGSKSTLDGVPSTQSTITETTSETTNTSSGENQPSDTPLPIEWQIAAGVKDIVTPDQKLSQYRDVASLIAMQGFGINQHLAWGIVYEFMHTRDILIPESKIKSQRKAVKDMIAMGVTPSHVTEATAKLMNAKMTVTDLYSISKTAIDLANPAESDNEYHGASEGV